MHIAGNSYGANVTLTLLTERPDRVATAAVHEPPLIDLLEGTGEQALARELSVVDADLAVVRDLISSGNHRDAAEYFIDHVALGPGTWVRLPEAFRSVMEADALTYLDESTPQYFIARSLSLRSGEDVQASRSLRGWERRR